MIDNLLAAYGEGPWFDSATRNVADVEPSDGATRGGFINETPPLAELWAE